MHKFELIKEFKVKWDASKENARARRSFVNSHKAEFDQYQFRKGVAVCRTTIIYKACTRNLGPLVAHKLMFLVYWRS